MENLPTVGKARLAWEYVRIRYFLRKTRKGKLTHRGLKGRLYHVQCLLLGRPVPEYKAPVVRIMGGRS